MGPYYYIATAVPRLKFDEPPDITFGELVHLLEENLSAKEMHQVQVLRRLVDIYNLCSYVRREPLDPHGNLSVADIEEARITGVGVPEYSQRFFEKYEGDEDRIRNLGELVANFFHEEIGKATGFLKRYLQFEREMRLILTAFRAKAQGRDIVVELQHEDPNDDMVAQIIAQKDAETFEPPEGYEGLKSIFVKHADQPLELHRALGSYRFDKLDEMMENEIFSIGYLLGYTVKLMICERIEELKK